MSTTPTEPRRASGLLLVLAATAVAGVSGYAIQLLAAALLPDAPAYLAFSAFWSTLYLLGSAVGGVQQEIARATRPRDSDAPASQRRLVVFTLAAAAVVVVATAIIAWIVGPSAFGAGQAGMASALIVGLLGYLLTSVATGLFYGLSRLGAVAALITVDAVLRGAAVVIALIAGAPLEVLSFAIALPFGIAVAAVWVLVRRGVRGRYTLDVDAPRLARNALHTVVAAAATGLMVTGLPLLFRLSLDDATPLLVASLTLVVTLTRAPLIIPLMALQSFLVVRFRNGGSATVRLVRRYLLLALAVAAVAAVAAWFLGPPLVALVSAGRYAVGGGVSAVVVTSAALVGAMCVTGPALLAQDRHRLYAVGWVVAAIVTVAALFLVPGGPMMRALVALVLAPLSGLAVHVVAIERARRAD